MTDTVHGWLTSDAATPWLILAAESLPPSASFITRLRRDLSAEQAALVCQQAELRVRAKKKFSSAERMFFTAQALEQATDERIASYKARSFAQHARVADLCCGVGGDLISLAKRTKTVGVDHDANSALFAGANLAVHGHCAEQVVCADVRELRISDFDAWHIDPDRRPDNRRTTNLDRQRPSWSVIEAMLGDRPNAAIKLAPASKPPRNIARTAEFEWIGTRRECKQLLVRCGALARHPGRRTATIVDGKIETVVAKGSGTIEHRDRVGALLYEPHPTLLAAQIVQEVAADWNLESFALVGPGKGAAWGYLTADDWHAPTGFDRFEVVEDLPFDRKTLVRAVQDNQWKIHEVKLRGVRETSAQIASWFRGTNGIPTTLIVAPTTKGVRGIFARREVMP